ncbi:MAG: hypothetical protein R2794_05370 [Chitinophagales bacterium]
MKKFLSRYFEYILIAATIALLFMRSRMPLFGERVSMLMFGTLSFYYLASAVLVFLDKQRIGRIMRLMYLFGLWSVSISVIGIMMRSLLMQHDKELLVICVSSGIGILVYIWLSSRRVAPENKEQYAYYVKPLIARNAIALILSLGFLVGSNYGIYSMFGTHKFDPVYTEKVVNAYEHADDTSIVNDFKRYDASLNDSTGVENRNAQ